MDAKTKTGLMAVGIVGGIFAVVGGGYLFVAVVSDVSERVKAATGGPPSDVDKWSHNKLVSHLASRGCDVWINPHVSIGSREMFMEGAAREIDPGLLVKANIYYVVDESAYMWVTNFRSTKAAEDAIKYEHVKNAFSWGPFVFEGPSKTLQEKMHKALY